MTDHPLSAVSHSEHQNTLVRGLNALDIKWSYHRDDGLVTADLASHHADMLFEALDSIGVVYSAETHGTHTRVKIDEPSSISQLCVSEIIKDGSGRGL